jgi:LmbE family N-acetylglucosaminyl deacetylase
LPYGLTNSLRQPVNADFYVDIKPYIDHKAEMLAKHKSQKEWLDISQGLDAYIITMKQMCAEVGMLSGRFDYAEGWIRHSHLGFCDQDDNPMADILKEHVTG